ncbi:hypothetical protein MMC20_001878 [Loxospora ochrophaea]|nr:hypothetical protein [Loxospora ochrophaea]
MKSSFVYSILPALFSTVSAQISFTADGTINCSGALYNGSNVCASDSLTSNIIIRCSNGTGYAGNCNDELAGLPPIGVKLSALCVSSLLSHSSSLSLIPNLGYESGNMTGDAACSFNSMVYPDSGDPYPVPGSSSAAMNSSSNDTSTAAGTTTSDDTSMVSESDDPTAAAASSSSSSPDTDPSLMSSSGPPQNSSSSSSPFTSADSPLATSSDPQQNSSSNTTSYTAATSLASSSTTAFEGGAAPQAAKDVVALGCSVLMVVLAVAVF